MTKPLEVIPNLIAHRGYSGKYPENTLLAYEAAYEHGARLFELDIQLSADRVPFLHHDRTLKRMAADERVFTQTKAKQVKSLAAAYPTRFADKFKDNRFTTFKKFCKWLSQDPACLTFVEIKQESIDAFGIPVVVDEVLRRIHAVAVESQVIIISFNHQVLEYVRKVSSLSCGWVLPEWDQQHQAIATQLNPEYLFSGVDILPPSNEEIWQGSWQWALYNLDDVDSALSMIDRGFRWLETNEIGTLMASEKLNPR